MTRIRSLLIPAPPTSFSSLSANGRIRVGATALGCALLASCTADDSSIEIEAQIAVDDGEAPHEGAGSNHPSAPLAAPTADPVHFELTCDDSATCCPPGLGAVVGTAAADTYSTSDLNKCYVALGSNDTVTNSSASGLNAALGGPGDDTLTGGYGPAVLHGGDGNDNLYGRAAGDFLRGGPGADFMRGNLGNDVLEGNGGDDTIHGDTDDDILVGGAGADVVRGGDGSDVVIVYNVCELAANEWLMGEGGTDTLIIPVPLTDVQALGVTVSGFENIVVAPAAADCGVSCECPPLAVNIATCDGGMGDPDDLALYQSACASVTAPTVASILAALPTAPDQDDVDQVVATGAGTQVTTVASSTPLSFIGQPAADPIPTLLPPVGWQTGVSDSEEPCDFPEFVPTALPIGESCTAAQRAVLEEDLPRAKFFAWRAKQVVDRVFTLVEANNLADAELLWNQGQDELALSFWFGEFDEGRLGAVKKMYDHVWSTFDGGNWSGTEEMHVQCWNPWGFWDVVKALAVPDLWLAHYFLNPCAWWEWGAPNSASAHTALTLNLPWSTLLNYDKYSFEVCRGYYDNDPRARAATLLHEVLHHQFNGFGEMTDRHVGFCGGGPCYDEAEASDLAVNAPDVAVRNNSNYEWYARWISWAYTSPTGEGCDLMNNAPCTPSNCCGNEVMEPGEGEVCDTADFGGAAAPRLTCLDYGWSEGFLQCSSDCTSIDPSRCTGECGNELIDPFLNEECDGSNLNGYSCESFGHSSGFLLCTPDCKFSLTQCGGSSPTSPPAGYDDCGVTTEDCDTPEGCHDAPEAGLCPGGPCLRTDPNNDTGWLDPFSSYHPRGDFVDVLGNLHYCESYQDNEMTCVDEDGWGVCKVCGVDTMLGCSCNNDDMCGAPDLLCWGKDYPNGGFCWPPEGPPNFQCEQGACGQSLRDENDPSGLHGEEGTAWCQHYDWNGKADDATCQPERCNALSAVNCSMANLVCKLNPANDSDCTVECLSDADCELPGWPAGMQCGQDQKCTP